MSIDTTDPKFASLVCDQLGKALRQYCVSPITGVVWNLICIAPEQQWLNYGQLVIDARNTGLDWITAAKYAALQYRKYSYNGFWRKGNVFEGDEFALVHWQRCLYLAFEGFSEEDWQLMMTPFTSLKDEMVQVPNN